MLGKIYIQEILTFKVYSSMNFDKYILPHDQHHSQDIEYFYHQLKLGKNDTQKIFQAVRTACAEAQKLIRPLMIGEL